MSKQHPYGHYSFKKTVGTYQGFFLALILFVLLGVNFEEWREVIFSWLGEKTEGIGNFFQEMKF